MLYMTSFLQISAHASVVLSRVFRLFPPNFSAVGSLGFFGSNPLLFFAGLVAHDYFFGGLYNGFTFTYLGFASYAVLGRFARNSTHRQLVLLPVASFLFFIFSNLGVWWYWFPHTLEGLLRCYTLALPFYKNTVISDLVFGYGYMLIRYVHCLIRNPLSKTNNPLVSVS